MSWINPTKTSKKIDNYVKINDETMWLAESDDGMDVKIHKFHCASLRYETFYCTVCSNSPFHPEPGELQVYFLLYQNAIKLYCVFWLPLFYPDPVKLYSVSPISIDSEELYSVSPYLPISCRHVELYRVSLINLHCILQNCYVYPPNYPYPVDL